MNTKFYRLNEDWNAEPNAPNPIVAIEGRDIVLRFLVNPFRYPGSNEDDCGILRFIRCERYRLGPTNDEGWYSGQCRFSKLAPAWGEFYVVEGDEALLEAPMDWSFVGPRSGAERHYLFYFRDKTFECVAEQCVLDGTEENSLLRAGKDISQPRT